MRVVAHRRFDHCAGSEIHRPLIAADLGAHAQPTAFPREVEQLEHVVDPDVLERAFDCHDYGCSIVAMPRYFRAAAWLGLNFRTRANARAASRVRFMSSSDSPRTTRAAKWYTLRRRSVTARRRASDGLPIAR